MCAPTRKSCGSAARSWRSCLYDEDAAESEPAGFGSDIGKTEGKESVFSVLSVSSYGSKQKLLTLPSRLENHEATVQ